MDVSNDAMEETFLCPRRAKWIVGALLVYFGLRLVYFATSIGPFVPPDEVTHFGLSRIFSKVLLLPSNTPETYEHGLVTNIPWLYYWLMGKLLPLNFFGISDLVFLRLANIPFAFGTVYYASRTLQLLTSDRLARLLLRVAMTNTLMFSFLSAAVSYDNLLNLAAAAAIYYLLAFFKERSGSLLALSLICQLVGSLVKVTFLPLLLLLGVLLLMHEFRHLRSLPGAILPWFKSAGRRGTALACAVAVLLVLNLQLYGGNYLRYGSLNPDMQTVLSREAAMQNRIEARNMIFELFKSGQVSRDRALQMTEQIKTSDRNDAVTLILNYEDSLKGKGEESLTPLQYLCMWFLNMTGTVYGIKAHQYMPENGPMLGAFLALLPLSAVALMVRWRPREEGAWLAASLVAIAGFYAFFILYFVNYRVYLDMRIFGMTVSGRYLLPIIGAVYVVSCRYLLRLFENAYLRLGFALLVALLFIASDFPFFIYHVTPGWFVSPQ